jgi:hypothetical protein
MELFKSISSLVSSVTNSKDTIPIVLISTHGNYKVIQSTIGEGFIDKIQDEYIEQYQVPDGMKIYKIETAALGVVNVQDESKLRVDSVCYNLKKYMYDDRSMNKLVEDLTYQVEDIHDEVFPSEKDYKKSYMNAVNRRQMITFEELKSKSLYYQKSFSRNLMVRSNDSILYYNSKYDMRINLIQSSRFTSEPRVDDIYKNIIEYQVSIEKSGQEIYLSEIFNYLKNIRGINQFLVVDLSCSTYFDIYDNEIIQTNENIDRLSRLFRLHQIRTSPTIRLDSSSPTFGKGGKRKKYRRNKKCKTLFRSRRRCIKKNGKTRKNKKIFYVGANNK